jgi:putative DNA primase/helicase
VVSVPFAYDPTAPRPGRWFGFLRSVWPDDEETIALLQEWFGYVISGRRDEHKIGLLVGPTRSGKGVTSRVLAQLVGRQNVAGPTLASLNTEFGLAPLLGKPLAVIGDARLDKRRDQSGVVEQLLSVSGEDERTVNIKYQQQVTCRLPTRFLILSNELPKFTDASGVIAHRFLPMRLVTSFLGREDKTIEHDIVATELPGVLNWALEGLTRLGNRGRFTWPSSAEEEIQRIQDLASPVAAFVRERCTVEPNGSVDVEDIWKTWKAWAEDNGQGRITKQQLGADLRSIDPRIKRHRHPGNGPYYYSWIRLGSRATNDGNSSGTNGTDGAGGTGDSTGSTGTSTVFPAGPADGDQERGSF